MDRNTEFDKLRREMLECRLCEKKFGFEPHPVLLGNVNSKIMQISQAPSQNVHRTRKPFDDASGRKLRTEWYKISDETFYNPDNFFISAIAKCYPGKSASGSDCLPPVSCGRKWLHREMELVDNKIFILIGGRAASFFFPKEDFAELVFRDNSINGKTTFVLPHPSSLNIKWFKDNPNFIDKRVHEIRAAVHEVLGVK